MRRLLNLVLVLTLLTLCHFDTVGSYGTGEMPGEAKQVWDYVKVRDDAYMFWWLYYSQDFTTKPLILWLQGGPGASSTGYGNFMEIGPQDLDGNQRTTTWLKRGSLLFVDNPVGTGFSYVSDDGAYAKNADMIAKDLLVLMTAFLDKTADFKKIPFYIFSESYGGKMAAAFAQALHLAILSGKVECNFQGFAMGDSWISPLDSVMTWGPYLYATSLVDEGGLATVNSAAERCVSAAAVGNWTESTTAWSDLETVVERVTGGVNFYNILQWESPAAMVAKTKLPHRPSNNKTRVIMDHKLKKLFHKHVRVHDDMDLNTFMNGPIRNKLKIIPKNVTWGGQSSDVFSAMSGDFMKNITDTVDAMLNTKLKVVVYSGQLDLIVDTLGTEQWIQKLKWSNLKDYNKAQRSPFMAGTPPSVAGFIKQYKNFSFYWILNAGHMVPSDAGEAALVMLDSITKS